MKVLVCGGAGYIGSHLVREILKDSKYSVVVFDNLSKGHRESVPANATLEIGDIRNPKDLDRIFTTHKINAVFHFCASIEVGESCIDPLKYYENNVSGTITLLQQMQKFNIKYFVFSSTAAVFGSPKKIPISPEDITLPINPYGDTKLVVETMLKWCDQAYGLKYTCLRYFNACGADKNADLGEDHDPETHLIPIILQVPLGKREKVNLC
jgi:UDP-glucose 4-epimerase